MAVPVGIDTPPALASMVERLRVGRSIGKTPWPLTAPETVTVEPSPASRCTVTCGSGVWVSSLRVIAWRSPSGVWPAAFTRPA